ncbi:hypothetical protein ACVILK_005762 [Bradyrhizobium embrapense]
MTEQALARRRQLDAATAALEQRDAERLLETFDPLAGRGQRKICARRALRDTARVGNRDEQLQVDQVEPHDVSPPRLRVIRRLTP